MAKHKNIFDPLCIYKIESKLENEVKVHTGINKSIETS